MCNEMFPAENKYPYRKVGMLQYMQPIMSSLKVVYVKWSQVPLHSDIEPMEF